MFSGCVAAVDFVLCYVHAANLLFIKVINSINYVDSGGAN